MKISFKIPLNFTSDPLSFTATRKRGKATPTPKIKLPELPYDYFESTIKSDPKYVPEDYTYEKNGRIPVMIHTEAKYPYQNFVLLLEEYFGDMVANEKNPNRPIAMIEMDVKSPDSIKEKMNAKNIRTKKGALDKIDDIIRARIVLNTGAVQEGDEVINRLAKAVKQGRVKIKEVSHYRPENKIQRKQVEYIRTKTLCEFIDMIRDTGKSILTKGEEKNTGYIATHIIFELHNGYSAELQIIGTNVKRLKEIEDVCFKIKCNKKVDPIFKDVVAALKKVKKDGLMDEYNLYTKQAYLHERRKAIGNVEDEYGEFLKLENQNLPAILDFNEISKLVEKIRKPKNSPYRRVTGQNFE